MAHRILVVEDSPDIQLFCRTVLEDEGFKVDSASSMADARKLYAANKPDLAIIDIGLPDGNGLDLMREWQSQPGSSPPMLFLSGRDELNTRLECFKAGARDYVLKPCAAPELLARVKVHLAIKRSQDDLTKRNQELELITRARQDMADMIVHDLKAPLASIKGTLQLITSHGLISKRSYSSLLEQAGSAADFMLLMLNDLLDVGQARTAGLRAEMGPVEPAVLFEKLKVLFSGRARSLKVELVFVTASECSRISADQNLLYRILANLITNAMKVSDPGQQVEVDCVHAGKNVRFMVLDRGGGVPESEKGKIFQKYETTGRKTAGGDTGTGIGLAFCAAASEAMKGKVWVEDRPGGGSRFILEFPFVPV
jgi:two-component system sensor histidine kinase/response regulator